MPGTRDTSPQRKLVADPMVACVDTQLVLLDDVAPELAVKGRRVHVERTLCRKKFQTVQQMML